jgi:hypothetical protein
MGNIEFERIWQDKDFFELRCNVNSDLIYAIIKIYVNDYIIDELSYKINQFINHEIQCFEWETGEKGNGSTPDFIMKVFYKDRCGHIRIEVFLEIDDGASLEEHNCCFYIDDIEVNQLERFGKGIQHLKENIIGTKISIL